MKDSFGRKIDYLRISLTDRCNLRCYYCMPGNSPLSFIHNDNILSFDEIVSFSEKAVSMGIRKIRLTGGEPLLRDDVVEIVRRLSEIQDLEDLSMTTNGILLSRYAGSLAKAGLQRVNISLDTVNPARYRKITGGDITPVMKGIEAAEAANFSKIKINCVFVESSDEPDAESVRRFCREKGIEVRFIRLMDLEKGTFQPVENGKGGICKICNRLRLTCDGKIKPCLFSDIAVDIRSVGCEEAMRSALAQKPISGKKSLKCKFHNIGG